MIKTAGYVTAAIVIVLVGFQYRYESLDPCEWLTQEMVMSTGLPSVSGLGKTADAVMSKGECLQNWMDLRVQEAESK